MLHISNRNFKILNRLVALLIMLLSVFVCVLRSQTITKFAVIGDYGFAGTTELDVATEVKSWNPEFIITLGDNNYNNGASSTIDANIGQYYHGYIFPYTGSYGAGATSNQFFPCLGNHDWNTTGAIPYLNYFTLPGNERYYEFSRGNVHFFSIDSDPSEPSGTSSTSTQANWLHTALAAATETWKIVYFHHPPYSSGSTHGSTIGMRWPFQQWGATIVLAGHEHIYERLEENGFPYIVNGLGGKSLYPLGTPTAGSLVRYNADFGAMAVEASETYILFQFITRGGVVIDSYMIGNSPTGVHSDFKNSPLSFSLDQNFPEPFNPQTTIRFSIASPQFVSLKIFNLLGAEVTSLVNESTSAGEHSVSWNAENLPSGVYVYRLMAGSQIDSRRMVLLK